MASPAPIADQRNGDEEKRRIGQSSPHRVPFPEANRDGSISTAGVAERQETHVVMVIMERFTLVMMHFDRGELVIFNLLFTMLFSLLSQLPLSIKVWAIQQIAFHMIGLGFEYMDNTNALSKVRSRETDSRPYKKLLPKVLLNQCLVLLPCMVFCEWAGLCFTHKGYISTGRALLSLPVLAIGHDVVQYSTHRYLLHQPNLKLMRMLRHSVHHSTTAAKGISACYMSAPDFFLEIVLPYLVPLALIGGGGADLHFHALVVASGAFGGIYEHSGYDLALAFQTVPQEKGNGWFWNVFASVIAGIVSTRAHHEHHSRGQVSFSDGFGSPGLCDTIFATRWDMVPKHREEVEREWRAQSEQQTANLKYM